MKSILHRFDAFWFEPAPAERIAVLRIATGGFLLWYLFSRFDMLKRIAASDVSNFDPVGILSWMQGPLPAEVFTFFCVLMVLLTVCYTIGWNFRYTGPAFAILLLLFFTYRNSWSMIYHNRNALVLHAMILGLVASADAWSMDAWLKKQRGRSKAESGWQYGWPIKLICTVTLAAYFLAGIAKLAGELALEWANGSAMRAQIAVDALRKQVLGADTPPLFDWLYDHAWLFFLMGVLTFVLELGAPLVLIRKRLTWIWVVLTWMMHWGIYLIMGISFRYQMTGLIFLSFFDVEKLWITRKQNQTDPEDTLARPIILFDGICTLCNQAIRFIIKYDRKGDFDLASLQSVEGQRILENAGVSVDLSTMVLVKNGYVYTESDSALRIASHLGYPWKVLAVCLLIPKPLRDPVYRVIAMYRYRWFGKQTDSCQLIPAEERYRLIHN